MERRLLRLEALRAEPRNAAGAAPELIMAAWPRRCCTVQQRSKIFEAEPAGAANPRPTPGAQRVMSEALRLVDLEGAAEIVARELAVNGHGNREAAEILGVDHQTINNDVRGENSPPRTETTSNINAGDNANGENSPADPLAAALAQVEGAILGGRLSDVQRQVLLSALQAPTITAAVNRERAAMKHARHLRACLGQMVACATEDRMEFRLARLEALMPSLRDLLAPHVGE